MEENNKSYEPDEVNDIHQIINEISMKVQETEDAFIFSKISNFVRDTMCIEVSKQELIEAISLYRMKKEASEKYGCSNISDDWNTAVKQKCELDKAYKRGYYDGVEFAYAKLNDCLDKMKGEKDE